MMAESQRAPRRFVCVEHPARVENVDKMLETLGGIDKISTTYSNPSHRMELFFRPKDAFCKPAFGNRHNTTNLLLKVKRRRKKLPAESEPSASTSTSKALENEEENFTYESEILGVVDTTYKFQSLVDFQYLPMTSDGKGKFTPINHLLLPRKLESVDWLLEDAPQFILPTIFTRLENAGDYLFRKDPSHKQSSTNVMDPADQRLFASQCLRHRRTAFAHSIAFEDENVPTSPMDGAFEQMKSKMCTEEMVKDVAKLFSHRPIWPRFAIVVQTTYNICKVKFLLPLVAYSFNSGPWRGLWIKFGYDPRHESQAKIYQMLHFRVRKIMAANIINTKRSTFHYVLPNKINQTSIRVPLIQTESTLPDVIETQSVEELRLKLEPRYLFRPTVLPPFRQVFYQFCDIDVPEVQRIVAECPLPVVCHKNFGWLSNAVYEECRNILFNIVQQLSKNSEGDAEDITLTKDDDESDNASSDDESNQMDFE